MHPVEGCSTTRWRSGTWSSRPTRSLRCSSCTIAGFGAVNGHLGFDKLEVTDETALDSHAYAHYLHHKYFEVNYGGDGLIPLDRWFGTWHDGTREGDAIMDARFQKKKERVNARASRRPRPEPFALT